MKTWIDRQAALARLGVKPQTLYAYASRGRIRVEPDPEDSRRSLYNAEDIALLTTRRSRGRRPAAIASSAMAWGEPAVATCVSTVERGRLSYRGRDAIALARAATLEEAAALLWESPRAVRFDAPAPAQGDVFATLAALVAHAPPMLGRDPQALRDDAAAIVATIAIACGALPGKGPLHRRLAAGWDRPAAADRLRMAMVAMADHDLNASTFATRVAASTGASLAASILAGLCTLSGPRHGGAAGKVRALIGQARAGGAIGPLAGEVPGFGHPLYPAGDPRGALMLEGLALDPAVLALRDALAVATGHAPNCDFGLAAMADALDLPGDAPFSLFLIGRSLGWCAHAIEQGNAGMLIRPRGRYEGAPPA